MDFVEYSDEFVFHVWFLVTWLIPWLVKCSRDSRYKKLIDTLQNSPFVNKDQPQWYIEPLNQQQKLPAFAYELSFLLNQQHSIFHISQVSNYDSRLGKFIQVVLDTTFIIDGKGGFINP